MGLGCLRTAKLPDTQVLETRFREYDKKSAFLYWFFLLFPISHFFPSPSSSSSASALLSSYIYFVLRLNVDDIFFTFYIPPWMTIEYFSTAFLRCSLTQHDFSEDSAIPFCTFLTALQHNRVDRLCSSASLKFEKLHTKQHRWEFDDVISLKILISLFSLAIFFISFTAALLVKLDALLRSNKIYLIIASYKQPSHFFDILIPRVLFFFLLLCCCVFVAFSKMFSSAALGE